VAEFVAVEGGVEVTIRPSYASGGPEGKPWYHRRFRKEIRARSGSTCAAETTGSCAWPVRHPRASSADRGTTCSTTRPRAERASPTGRGESRAARPRYDRRRAAVYPSAARVGGPVLPARDWGRQRWYIPWFAVSGDVGLFLGAGSASTATGSAPIRTAPSRSCAPGMRSAGTGSRPTTTASCASRTPVCSFGGARVAARAPALLRARKRDARAGVQELLRGGPDAALARAWDQLHLARHLTLFVGPGSTTRLRTVRRTASSGRRAPTGRGRSRSSARPRRSAWIRGTYPRTPSGA
jgi:hypothetical protein